MSSKKSFDKVVTLANAGTNDSDAFGTKGLVGNDIRRLRKTRKMTLSDLSKKTDLSVGYLSQIERNLSSPTLKAMFDISHALDVNIGWFFHEEDGQKREESLYIVRADKRRNLRYESGITDNLLNTKAVSNLEVLYCTFEPGSTSGEEYYNHEGEECGVILSGQLELWIDDKVYLLNEGDSFSFPSTMNHRYRNPGEEMTHVVWSITPPSY